MSNSFRSSVIKTWHAVRATWLVVGVSIVLLLLLEACVRVRNAVTVSRRGPETVLVGDPQTKDWYADFEREYDGARTQRWKPYVYFGRAPSYAGRYISIDSAGHRVTPQPTMPAVPVARVFMFGGSTMWGDSQRAEHTIAAEVARRLQTLAPPGQRVEVVNFGETGWVTTQELIQLELELRSGNRPDVVVFYDGLNDVSSTVQWGSGGIAQNESKRIAEFRMGRALDRAGYDRGLGKDLRTLGLLTGQAFRQLALVDWVQSLRPAPSPEFISVDSAAHSTVKYYVANARLVEALAGTYDFTPVYVWQPSVHATAKHPNPYERRLLQMIDRNPYHKRVQAVHRVVPAVLDSVMSTVAPQRFVDAADLFRGDTMAVYTDWLGHNTEESVPRIVDAFWPAVEAAVRPAIARRRVTIATIPAATRRGPGI